MRRQVPAGAAPPEDAAPPAHAKPPARPSLLGELGHAAGWTVLSLAALALPAGVAALVVSRENGSAAMALAAVLTLLTALVPIGLWSGRPTITRLALIPAFAGVIFAGMALAAGLYEAATGSPIQVTMPTGRVNIVVAAAYFFYDVYHWLGFPLCGSIVAMGVFAGWIWAARILPRLSG